jgi:hypothetical protein
MHNSHIIKRSRGTSDMEIELASRSKVSQELPSTVERDAPNRVSMADFDDRFQHDQEKRTADTAEKHPPFVHEHPVLQRLNNGAIQNTVDETFGSPEIVEDKSSGLDAKRTSKAEKKPAPTSERQAHPPARPLTLKDRTRIAAEISSALLDSHIYSKR